MSMPATADRNLLFGILAVQMDFVSQAALIQAMNAWVLNKSRPLGQVLVEQQSLSAERRALLEALVEEHLKRHNQDVSQSLAAVSSVTSACDVLGQITDQDVQASLAGLTAGKKAVSTHTPNARGSETLPVPMQTMSVNMKTLSGFRYQVLRPHAKGGLGEVLVARDQELHREVALKQIQANRADDPDSQVRFLMEAEITGGLEHPGIVPVYGLGYYDDGRPYYAMRFIRGDSLKEAIARYHCKSAEAVEDNQLPQKIVSSLVEPRSESERNLELRGLLGRFIDVCNAIAYAHSRGVLHRDLKPGNIMLGKYGETLVVDWGLAKPLSVKPTADTVEPQLEPPSVSGSAQTLMGSAVGTPQYMSPEQAAGRLNQLGPASDVYSLGATLYCLLTGQAPFQGQDVGVMLKQVQNGAFPAPRQIDRRISKSLESICLKAMALEPNQRYATPKSLAQDIENWLADEPVTAYRESTSERIGRWARRHKPWVVAGTLLLFTAVVGLSGSTILINAERQRTQDALAETERAHIAAEDALAKAQLAERSRIEAQVDALLRATPESVPPLLAALEPVRETVEPMLQQQLARKDLSPSQSIRLQLALLPNRPDLAVELGLALLQANAEEFAMLRAGLKDHGSELAEPLWQTLHDSNSSTSARFRAACALAAFDPKNSDWPNYSELVAEWLVHQNPLMLGTWVEMLKPVRAELLPPLAQQFRESEAVEIRSVANTVIRVWAADQVELLTRLLMDADPEQFLTLLPQLKAHKDQALAIFREKIQSRLKPEWPPLPAELPNAEPRHAEQIEQAAGLITDKFALVQMLPLEQFVPLAEGLKPAGYRPVRYRPFLHRGKILVAAVWQRDKLDWKLETSLSKEALLERDEIHQAAGFTPVDVAGYFQPSDAPTVEAEEPAEQDLFGAVWVKSPLKPDDSQILCGLSFRRFATQLSQFQRQSSQLGLMTIQVFHSPKDEVIYSAVLQRQPEKQSWRALWGATEQQFEIMETSSWMQHDACLWHLAEQPTPESPFLKEINELSSEDQGSGLAQAFVRPFKNALVALGEDNNQRAEELLTQAINTVKILPQPFYLRSLAYARLGKATEAKQDYLEAGQVQARAVPLLSADQGRSFELYEAYTFSQVAALLGEPNVGETQLEQFLEANRHQPEALYVAARAYSVLSRIVLDKPPREDLEQKPEDAKTLSARFADRAVALLRQAFENGLDDNTGILFTQPDFDPIRERADYLKLIEEQHSLRRFALVWHIGPLEVESRRTEAADSQQHLQQAKTLMAEGFRPIAITVATPTRDSFGHPIAEDSQEMVAISVWQRPVIAEALQDQNALQQANAGIALWHLEPAENHWPVIESAMGTAFEATLIHRLSAMKVPPAVMVNQIRQESSPELKRSLLLALGNYSMNQFSQSDRDALLPLLVQFYREESDSGLHSAAEWLIRKWGHQSALEKLHQMLKSNRPTGGKKWYINGQGQTLAVVDGPLEFTIGAALTDQDRFEDELQHRVRIPRRFAIATTETTVTDFLRFNPEADFTKTSSPDPHGPIINVDWFEAVKYCRWLSEQEGIPEDQMCYPPVEDIGPSMSIPGNFLERTGYRLPTESEWECAARAGGNSRFLSGNTPDLLAEYAWFKSTAQDHAHRVGLLRPNAWGLFDVLGNAGEWCHDEYQNYRLPPRGFARIDGPPVQVNGNRVGRGGSLLSDAPNSRLSRRFGWNSQQQFRDVGFRVARTLPTSTK